MYVYRSPVGLMKISFDQKENAFSLYINGECYGVFDSAEAAAKDVFAFYTGCLRWDNLLGKVDNVPIDIDEWETA